MKFCYAFILVLLAFTGYSQNRPAGKAMLQVSGIITDADSSNAVPYVTISNKTKDQTYSANYMGFYSFIAHPGDTLTFKAVGYKTETRIIPTSASTAGYTLMVSMKAEIKMIQAVRIYPWATVEEFTRSFLALRIADDDMEIARKNLSPKSLRSLGVSLPRDPGEISSMNNRLEHERSLSRNMVQTNPLLNPFAWGRLLQSIISGDKSRQSEN